MTGLLLIGMLLAALAAYLLLRAATMQRALAVRAVERVGSYGYPAREIPEPARRSLLQRALERSAGGVGGGLRRVLVGGSDEAATALLRGAGVYRLTPAGYAALRLALPAAGLLVVAWIWAAGAATLPALLATGLVLASAWLLPPLELRRRRDARLARVDRGLADLVDFLVVTIEAGVGLGSAFAAAAARFAGPLGEELRLTVQEQAMGLSTEEALRNLLARCDSPAMRSFVRSVVQAETLGTSIGQILRALSVEMRRRRRQAAEERAHKAPVKIVFPLALLILPAMFLVVLGPAVYRLMHGIGA